MLSSDKAVNEPFVQFSFVNKYRSFYNYEAHWNMAKGYWEKQAIYHWLVIVLYIRKPLKNRKKMSSLFRQPSNKNLLAALPLSGVQQSYFVGKWQHCVPHNYEWPHWLPHESLLPRYEQVVPQMSGLKIIMNFLAQFYILAGSIAFTKTKGQGNL